MTFATATMLENLLMPPAGGFILLLLGVLLIRFRLGRRLILVATLLLYVACLPVLANALILGLDRHEPVAHRDDRPHQNRYGVVISHPDIWFGSWWRK